MTGFSCCRGFICRFADSESHEVIFTRGLSRPALTQSIEILLDNALVHGSGDVEVRVCNDGGFVEIAIKDEGRLVESNGDADVGTDRRTHGLGLLLARNLLRPDGGRVELTSTTPTTFVVRVRAHRDDAETEPGVRLEPLDA